MIPRDTLLLLPRRKKFLRWARIGYILVTISFILIGCQGLDTDPGNTAGERNVDGSSVWVERVLSEMTLQEMVSQMIIIGMPDEINGFDPEVFSKLREDIIDFGAGGIVFLRTEPLSQSMIITDLQSLAKIPLLVAQDMEWGAAMRVQYATEFPQAMGIGATFDPGLSKNAGRITAIEARTLGVNMILAPVADVNSNPDNPIIATRSYGDDPEQVSRFVSAFIRGVQEEGLLATAKHFPGHGSTSADSHSSLPLVAPERFQTEIMDLRPFKSAISSNVAAIMTGHLAIAHPDDENFIPATLSTFILQSLLRDQLGFDGLIISDAMNMAGVGRAEEADSITVRAVIAGVDLLLMPRDPVAARRAILAALTDGSISADRIRNSIRRILRAKESIGLSSPAISHLQSVRSTLTSAEHAGFANILAHRSLVLVSDNGELEQLRHAGSVAVVPITDATSTGRVARLTKSLKRYSSGIRTLEAVSRETSEQSMAAVRNAVIQAEIVLVADLTSERRADSDLLKSIYGAIQGIHDNVIILAMGSPYATREIDPESVSILVSFGESPIISNAVSDALYGRATICGHLPIQISDSLQRGDGICRKQEEPRIGIPEEVGMSSEMLRNFTRLIDGAIADSAFPGAALAVGRAGVLGTQTGYGHFTYESDRKVTTTSLFDLASLTKVIATTTAIMQLYEADLIRLDDPVPRYIPSFAASEKDGVTIRQLLTHTGGLIPFRPFYRNANNSRDNVIKEILGDSLEYEPGSKSVYSDFGPIVLALIVEKVTGMPFEEYTRRYIFEPLEMNSTGFRSVVHPGKAENVVPTERDEYFRHRLIQGVVHDETAYLLGGTAGHAGLFSTIEDLSRFAFMMLNEGRTGDRRFLKSETIRLFTAAADSDGLHTRALGWDTRSLGSYSSAGSHFGRLAYGHTGFTGTSIWIDPDQQMFVILLTNRIYPSRGNSKLRAVRPAVADLAFESIIPL